MKRILIALGSFPPDFTGAGLRASRLAQRIHSKYGLEFDVLCIKKRWQKYDLAEEKRESTEYNSNMNITRLKMPKEEGWSFPFYVLISFFKVNRYLMKHQKKIGVIHFFSFAWMNRMIMLANVLFYKKKTILDVTLEGSDDPKSLVTDGKRNKLLSPFTKFLLKRMDRIIVSSADGLNSCLETGIAKENISVEPHPCDEKNFGSISFKKKSELRRKLGLQKDKFILLNVGRIQDRKNQLFIIRALEKLKKQDILLILIGPYDKNDEYFVKIKEFTKANNLGKQVLVIGEKKNINEYMIASDLLVFASKKEGFPNVIAESAVSGLPIVTTTLTCIAPYINKKNGILIENHEKFDLNVLNKYSRAIKKAHDNPKTFNKESIRKFGIEKLSSKKLDENKKNQYRALLKRK